MMNDQQKVTELNDVELMELTGGVSFVSKDAAMLPGIPQLLVAYGLSPYYFRAFYGIFPLYGIRSLNKGSAGEDP